MTDDPIIFRKLEQFSFEPIIRELDRFRQEAPSENERNVAMIMALMNLVSIEEHLVFTGTKTQKEKYFELIKAFQPMKQTLFKGLAIPVPERSLAERFLAASMRLMEVGTKQYCQSEKTSESSFFSYAYRCYLLFETIRVGEIERSEIRDIDVSALDALYHYLESFFKPDEIQPLKNRSPIDKDLKIQDLNTFVEKIDSLKKQHRLDLSSDQDLTLGIMNLIVLEEDFFLWGARTHQSRFYDLLCQIREIRKTLLQKLVAHYEGEVWCISKHLLSASMRMMQIGFLTEGQKTDRDDFYQQSYDLYSLFWGVHLGVIGGSLKKKKTSLLNKLGLLVKKAVDCCLE